MDEGARERRLRAARRLRDATADVRDGFIERALATLDSGEPSHELSPAAQSLRSDLLARLGRDEEALAAACKAFEAKPARADFALRYAERLIAGKRADEALHVLERACALGSPAERIIAGVSALPVEPQFIRRLYKTAFGPIARVAADRPTDAGREERIRHAVGQHVAAWQGLRHRPDSLVVLRNENGSRPPLFWCFQSETEFAQLAAALGPDQPVFGMRSGHHIIGYSPPEIHALARLYAAEMLEIASGGAFTIGGNCQGGIIAYEAALALHRAGRAAPMLVLMELLHYPPYDGPVSFVFGRDSALNPDRTMPDPERFFSDTYRGGVTLHAISGSHGQYFSDEHIASLADCVNGCLLRATACDKHA